MVGGCLLDCWWLVSGWLEDDRLKVVRWSADSAQLKIGGWLVVGGWLLVVQ